MEHHMRWLGTCSIDNPKDWHVTFARSFDYLKKLDGFIKADLHLMIYLPPDLFEAFTVWAPPNSVFVPSEYPEYDFAKFHNEINNGKGVTIQRGNDTFIHPTVVVDDGIREVNGPPGSRKIHLKHIGNVVIGEDVRIGPFTFIERAVFDETIIGNGCRIDAQCVIGHQAIIGENTVIASSCGIGGSSRIGKNCWIGGNVYVRNGVKVCDGTIIGCSSGVTKDITEPGVYGGVPAKFIKPVPEGYNF